MRMLLISGLFTLSSTVFAQGEKTCAIDRVRSPSAVSRSIPRVRCHAKNRLTEAKRAEQPTQDTVPATTLPPGE